VGRGQARREDGGSERQGWIGVGLSRGCGKERNRCGRTRREGRRSQFTNLADHRMKFKIAAVVRADEAAPRRRRHCLDAARPRRPHGSSCRIMRHRCASPTQKSVGPTQKCVALRLANWWRCSSPSSGQAIGLLCGRTIERVCRAGSLPARKAASALANSSGVPSNNTARIRRHPSCGRGHPAINVGSRTPSPMKGYRWVNPHPLEWGASLSADNDLGVPVRE
jgi:hypothetical protein